MAFELLFVRLFAVDVAVFNTLGEPDSELVRDALWSLVNVAAGEDVSEGITKRHGHYSEALVGAPEETSLAQTMSKSFRLQQQRHLQVRQGTECREYWILLGLVATSSRRSCSQDIDC